MRHWLLNGILAAMLCGNPALAKKGDAKKGDAKDAEGDETPSGGMMDTGDDPAESEKFEQGRFAPQGKTGKLKEDEEAAAAEQLGTYEKRRAASLDVILGSGKAIDPRFGPSTTNEGSSFAFVVGGIYDLNDTLGVGVRVPWTTAEVDVESYTRGKQSSSALGNPELYGVYRVSRSLRTLWSLRVGVGIPVAQGTPDPTNTNDQSPSIQGYVQRQANAAGGFHDPELYQPKNLPVTLGGNVAYVNKAFGAHAEAKAVVSPNIGGEIENLDAGGANNEQYELQPMAFALVVGGGGSYEVLDDIRAGVDAWVQFDAARQVEINGQEQPPERLNLVLEPNVSARFGSILPRVGLLLPVVGELAGETLGFRVGVEVGF